MNAMDKFTELKTMKEGLLRYEWSAEGKIWDGLRLFYDSVGKTSEHSLTQKEKSLCVQAMQHVERDEGSISFSPYSVVADGMRKVLARYCNAEMARLAKLAQEEANDVLEQLKNEH